MRLPFDKRLVVVIGKGGVGKSSVTAALAAAAAREGRRTLVCELAARERMSELFAAAPVGPRVGHVAPGVDAVAITPAEAMREYALMILKFERLYTTVFENRFVAQFLKAIPSLAELVCLGKIVWHVHEKLPDGRFRYDWVLVDAPATGHGLSLLRLPRTLAKIVPPGPMLDEAKAMLSALEDPALTTALLVTIPEELPVTETLELARGLRDQVGMSCAGLVLNGCVEPLFKDDERAAAAIPKALGPREARAERTARYARLLEEELALPITRLPYLFEGKVGRDELEAMADCLTGSKPCRPLPDRERAQGEGARRGEGAAGDGVVRKAEGLARATTPWHAAADHHLLVCMGAGGVGKTTVAAALALQAALEGRRVCVCTIDPARRLAHALGLDTFGAVETRVPLERLGGAPRGELFAAMLDLKRSWDELIRGHLSPERAEALMKNPFYEQLSTALAGSQEYAALDKLATLVESGRYDLVILDTPPTANALDFLDAPERVLAFLGNETARTLLAPLLKAGTAGIRLFHRAGGVLVRTLSKLTGLALLEELARFLADLEPLYGAFAERAATVKALLASEGAGFVLVTSPEDAPVAEALQLAARLKHDGLSLAGVVVNRTVDFPEPTAPPACLPETERIRLEAGLRELRALARAHAERIERLAEGLGKRMLHVVPQLDEDPHDLAGLAALAAHWSSPPRRGAGGEG